MKQFIIFFSLLILLSCKTNQTISSADNRLIKDCPEELITNMMPTIGKPSNSKANQYYIYKEVRREIKEFDSVWVSKNCKVKVTVVQ
jgi:hypothetical protein